MLLLLPHKIIFLRNLISNLPRSIFWFIFFWKHKMYVNMNFTDSIIIISNFINISIIIFGQDDHILKNLILWQHYWGSRGIMVGESTRNPKVCEFESRAGRNCQWGGVNVQALSPPSYHEVLLSKAPNPQLLPGRRNINGCPLLQVCVHGVCDHCCVCALWMGNAEHKFRVWSLGCMSRQK